MELKPEESSVMICWVMTVDPIAASAVRHTFYHVLFLSQICWGQHLCTTFLRTTTSTPFTYRWFIDAVLNGVNPSIAQHGLGLLLLCLRILPDMLFA
jgi:hypothetical protein